MPTYLHPKAQRYCIAQRSSSYSMRAKDIIGIQGASLILFGLVDATFIGVFGFIPEDISTKLSVFYPAIGTTQTSLSMDYIRLIAGVWTGSPAATAGDGYINFSINNTTRMQLVKTGFTPPANQTSYHLSYFGQNAVAPTFPTQIDIGTTAGSGMIFAMNGLSGTVGNLYNITSTFIPTIDNTGSANTLTTDNLFIVSRTISTQENFYYLFDGSGSGVPNPDEFRNSPIASNTTSYAPGQLQLGNNTGGPGGTYTTKNCEGFSAGSGLTVNQSLVLRAAFYYIHINK